MMPSQLTLETILLERQHRFESQAAMRRFAAIAATRAAGTTSPVAEWRERARSFLITLKLKSALRGYRPSAAGQGA